MPCACNADSPLALRARPPNSSLSMQHGFTPCPSRSPTQDSSSIVIVDSEIHPLPSHWNFELRADPANKIMFLVQSLVLVAHRVLGLVAFGQVNLQSTWDRCHGTDGDWGEGRDMVRERIQHTNIVVCFICFCRGRTTLDFCRQVYFSPPLRPSLPPIRPRIPLSFRTRNRALCVSSLQPSDYPSRV